MSMRQLISRFSVGTVLVTLGVAGGVSAVGQDHSSLAPGAKHKAEQMLGGMPLTFEKNQGQAEASARFMAHGDGYALTLSAKGAGLTLAGEKGATAKLEMELVGADAAAAVSGVGELPGITNYLYGKDPSKWVTKVPNFEKVKVAGALPGIDVVYYGNNRELEYDFDVVAGADAGAIRLRFAGAASLRVDGDGNLIAGTAAGEVGLKRPRAYQVDAAGERLPVEAQFVLADDGLVRFELGAYDHARALVIDPTIQYSTWWGGVLKFSSTYVSHEPVILGMSVDSSGAAYIYGIDESGQEQVSTPSVTLGNGCPTGGTCINLFVTKFDPSKSGAASLVYTTIIPAFDINESNGSNGAGLYNGLGTFPTQALAVDASGNAFFTGGTDNPLYPTTAGAYQTTCNINPALTNPTHKFCVPTGYVTELSPNGSAILYSTMLGSLTPPLQNTFNTTQYYTYSAWGTSLAVDSSHIVYLGAIGYNGFPNTSAYGCNTVTFGVAYCYSDWAVKLDTTKTGSSALIYSEPFYGNDIAVATDGVGNLYWSSHGGDFTAYEVPMGLTPIPYNGYLTVTSSTGNNVALHKLNSTGAVVYATFMYGSSTTALQDGVGVTGIAADPDGRAYLAGLTEDPTWPNVNGLVNPVPGSQSSAQGWAYVSAFDTTQTGTASLVYSTVFDGTDTTGSGLAAFATNGCGSVTLVGGSNDAAFPLVNALPGAAEPTTYYKGIADYAAVIDTKLVGSNSLLFSSTIPGGEIANYAFLNQLGNLYITAGVAGGGWNAGTTFGTEPNEDPNNYPITANAYQSVATQGGTPGFYPYVSGTPDPAFMMIANAIPAGCYTATPNPVSFGNQQINTTSSAQTITFTNTSSVALNFSSVVASSGFNETNTCGTSIAKNASCTASVTFTPTATGAQTGTLTFTDTDATVTQVVPLSGTGTAPTAPQAVLTPTTVPFGNQAVNTTSATQVVVLSNPGTATLTGISVSLTGTNPTAFADTSACGTTLAAGSSCNISVTFTPTSAVSYSASLTVADNATGSPQTAPLTGAGTTAPATVAQLQFTPSQLSLLAGTGKGTLNGSGDGGPALSATFDALYAAAQDAAGNIYVIDNGANDVRKIDVNGNISLFAGVPGYGPGGFGGDGGPATSALLSAPNAVAVDAAGNVYIADYGNLRVRKVVPSTGIITTYVGNGSGYFNGSPGPNTPIPSPEGICFDPSGNLYITSTYAQLIIKVTPAGAVSIFAGDFNGLPNGVAGYNGDNIPANTAKLDNPQGVASDQYGNIYIADTSNNRIRKVTAATGIITTVAGNGTAPALTDTTTTGDGGPATSAIINAGGIATDLAGDLFITAGGGIGGPNVVRKVDLNGNISTVAGGGSTQVIGGEATANDFGGLGLSGIANDGSMLISSFAYSVTQDSLFSAGPSGFLQFGGVNIGSTSSPQTVIFENTGDAALALSQTTYTASSPFTVTGGTCAGLTTLAPGATCTLAVTFAPTSAITYNGTIGVKSNGVVPSQIINLQGNGLVVASPQAVLTPTTVPFGNQTVSTTSSTQVIVLSNPGTATLNITSVSLGGTNPADFGLTNGCGATLAAGGTCNISVTFTPASATSFSATVNVVDSASNSPQSATLTGTGTAAPTPQAVLTPTTLSFPNTAVGSTSASLTTVLSNPGSATLNITSVTLTGANTADFAITNGCGATLAVGATCNISATFTPASAGSFTAAITVTDNAGNSPQAAALTGTGTAPQAVLTPTTLAFPNTVVGSTSASLTTVLSNPGTAVLNITGVTLTGANSADFAITNGCGATLAVGATCNISATFTPVSAASFAATISVADNAAGSPQTAALTGTGTAPQAVLTPTTLAFPSTTVGTTSASLTTVLSNPGNATLTITGVTLTGANTADFAITNGCGATLAAGATCNISATFTPASAASFVAAISVADNASGSPQSAALTGTGTPVAVPVAVVSPTSIAFGNQAILTTSATQTLTLSNTGTAALTLTTITLGGANPAVFAKTGGTCATSVAAGANCTVIYSFTPPSVGSFSATVTFTDNAASSPQVATLTGAGISPSDFSVSSSTTSQTVDPGGSASYTINVAAINGTFNSPVALTVAGLPAGATASFSPTTVTPGSTGASSVLTVQTGAYFASSHHPLGTSLLAFGLLPLLIALRRRRAAAWLAVLVLGIASLGLSGCAGGFFGPPPQTFTLTVAGASSSTQHSTTVTLSVQ